jgi:hypothetical protein
MACVKRRTQTGVVASVDDVDARGDVSATNLGTVRYLTIEWRSMTK